MNYIPNHIAPEHASDFDFTKDGKPLEYVWEANTEEGWADIVCTDRQGAFLPSSDPNSSSPYELIRVRGQIDAKPTTRKIGDPTSHPDVPVEPCHGCDFCGQPPTYPNYGCDFPNMGLVGNLPEVSIPNEMLPPGTYECRLDSIQHREDGSVWATLEIVMAPKRYDRSPLEKIGKVLITGLMFPPPRL